MQYTPDEAAPRPGGDRPVGYETGWCRVGADGVLRGWVVDHGDFSRRITVDIYVDERRIGSALADEDYPDLDFADRRHGLAFKMPPELHDGQPHVCAVRTVQGGFELRSRNPSFLLTHSGPLRLTQVEFSGSSLRGEVDGPVVARWPFLHLHAGTAKPALFPVRWSAGQRARFTGELQPGVLGDWLTTGTVLSYHGENAESGFSPWSLAAADWESRGADLVLRLSRLPFDRTHALQLVIRLSADAAQPDRVVPAQALNARTYVFALPDDLPAHWNASAEVLLPDGRAIAIAAYQHRSRGAGFLRNDRFAAWANGAPEHWTVEHAAPQRAAPPPGIAEGNALVLLDTGSETPGPRLRQELERPVGGLMHVGILARSTAPCVAVWRFEDAGGKTLASGEAPVGRAWQMARAAPDLGEAVACAFVLDIKALPGKAPVVEIGRIVASRNPLDLGDPAEAAFEPPGAEDQNLLTNADILDWPGGRLPGGGLDPAAQPDGWRITDPSGEPIALDVVPMRLLDPSAGQGGYALSIDGGAAARPLRIEIALKPVRLAEGTPLRLAFHAAPGLASGLLTPPLSHPGRWSSFGRVFLLARKTAVRGSAAVVARFSRGLVLQQGRTSYRFDTTALALPPGWADDEYSLHLCFEAEGVPRLALDSLRLVKTGVVHAPPPVAGDFEDPSIRAQMHQIALTAMPLVSARRSGGEPAAPRWQWPGSAARSVDVVICVHDALEETLACLASLEQATAQPHTVTVVDDASSMRTARALAAFVAARPWMRVVTNQENLGYTRSADRGIRQSRAELVVLLNSDTVVHDGWLERMIACLESDPMIAFVGPLSNAATYQSVPELRDPQGRWAVNRIPDGMSSADLAAAIAATVTPAYPRVPLLNGFCTLMRRDVFLQAGGMDGVAFPTGYGEENDLCLRVGNAGYELAVADDVYVYHSKSASFGSERRTALQKLGDAALREKHAGVDFTEIGRQFGESEPLIVVRDRVRAIYRGEADVS